MELGLVGSTLPALSTEQLANRLAVAQRHRPAVGALVVEALAVVAQRREDSGVDVGRGYGALGGIGASGVGLANHLTFATSATVSARLYRRTPHILPLK